MKRVSLMGLPKRARARRADRYWHGQLLLALLALLLAAGGLSTRRSDLVGHLLALCQDAAGSLLPSAWVPILLVPPLLIGLSAILAVGSVGRQLLVTHRLLRALGPARPLPTELEVLARRLGLSGQLRLVVDGRSLAFCAGLARPRVWLTTGLLRELAQDELAAVLGHEGHHVRHRDPLKLLVIRALADAFFYLPLVRDLGRAYEVHKELAADADVTSSPAGQVGLAKALLKLVAEPPVDLERAVVGPLSLGKHGGVTEARLDYLIRGRLPPRQPRRRNLLLSGMALLLFFVVAFFPMAERASGRGGGSCGSEGALPTVIRFEAP